MNTDKDIEKKDKEKYKDIDILIDDRKFANLSPQIRKEIHKLVKNNKI